VGLPELLDAVGYNYQEARYADDHKKFPQRIIFGSENSQTYAAWTAVRDNEFVAGQFLWTGIDYLGEANQWPNRANGAGLLDLCGFKKPLAWFRQSLWSDQPMVYVCVENPNRSSAAQRGFSGVENWNWPSNTIVNVDCFANCPEVTLMLNDKIIGTKNISAATNGVLHWQIPFESGVLKAVGRKDGNDVAEFELKTAGAASGIELIPDTKNLRADGKDICHLEIRVVDAQGVRVPDAEQEVTFEINGPVKLLGMGNGDLNSSEPYQGPTRKVFHGRGLAILESTRVAGEVTVKVSAPEIQPATFVLKSAAN
jgi:beta-galactosidase